MARIYYRKRRRKINKATGELEEQPPWIRKVVKDEIKALRFKNKALQGYDVVNWESFWEEYGKRIEAVTKDVYYVLLDKLMELLEKRAYLDEGSGLDGENADYYTVSESDYGAGASTGQFVDAWDIECKFEPSSNKLTFSLKYDISQMKVEHGYGRHLGLHASYTGQDFRFNLADYLDFPRKFMGEKGYRHSKGHWQSAFNEYCRTEGVEIFNELCERAGII